jgi:hypothetical protein
MLPKFFNGRQSVLKGTEPPENLFAKFETPTIASTDYARLLRIGK